MRHSLTPQSRRDCGGALLGLIAGLVLAAFGVLLGPARCAYAATVTVTNTSDAVDATDGGVSLREAITSINGGSNVNADVVAPDLPYGTNDTINFNISGSGVRTIALAASGLPTITKTVTIDGYSQPSASANTLAVGSDAVLLIELDGSALPSNQWGLRISKNNVTVRGLVINGFAGYGIRIDAAGSGSTIAGNFLGTDPSGTTARANSIAVYFASSAQNITIGGTAPAARNLLSGNDWGVYSSASDLTGTVIQGNYIGTDADGTASILNNGAIEVSSSSGITIGGTAPGAGNLVSGNRNGIRVMGAGTNRKVQGNLVGTDASGTVALGNLGPGIWVSGASGVLVGGTAPGARNVTSANWWGIMVWPTAGSDGTQILGNYVGTDITGTAPLGNTNQGIRLNTNAANVAVGGTAAGEGNLVAYNASDGVLLSTNFGVPANIAIRGNSIHSNGGLGIVLNGGNNGQASPALTSVAANGATTRVIGTLTSEPSTAFGLDFFANTACDGSGSGEGAVYLGSGSTTTNASGIATFTVPGLGASTPSQQITATATDPNGNTSEFSACHTIVPGVEVDSTALGLTEGGAPGTFTVALKTVPASAVTITPSFPSGQLGVSPPTLTFQPNQTAIAPQTFTVNAVDNSISDIGRTPQLTFTASSGDGQYQGASVSAVTTSIADDDPLSAYTVAGLTQAESASPSGTTTATLTLTMSPQSSQTVSVQYGTVAGTATGGASCTGGADYLTKSGTLTFTAGETSKSVDVTICGDFVDELDETFTVALASPSGASTLGTPSTATVTVTDATSQATLTTTDASSAEPANPSGTGTATVTVTLSPPSSQIVTVNYATTSGTATGGPTCTTGADYLTTSGTLTFNPGNTSKEISVTICGDAVAEGGEAFTVALTAPTGGAALGANATATVAVAEASGEPSLTVADLNTSEPANTTGSSTASLTVTLAPPSSQIVTVGYASASGTATGGAGCGAAGVDYVAASGSLTFNPGETSKPIALTICGDAVPEQAETLAVALSSPTGGAVLGTHATARVALTNTGGLLPSPTADAYSVVTGTSLTVAAGTGVLANDTGVGPPIGMLTAEAVTQPGHGSLTLAANGSFTYTPVAGFAGTDSFTYRASDGSFQSAPATVTLTVTSMACAPRPPVKTTSVVAGGKLEVRVESTPLNGQGSNPLRQISFGTLQNATVTLNGQEIAGGQTYSVPAGAAFVDFAVARVAAGQPTTVPIAVVDDCGEWRTLVGGGAAAGF